MAINVAAVLPNSVDPTLGSVEGSIGMQCNVPNLGSERPEAAHYRSKDVASLCHVSLRQLERYFNEKEGCSPQKWLNDLRLQEAPRLLLEEHHVKAVAFELRFTHPSHFIREFRRVYHCTPLEFVFSEPSQGKNRRFLLTGASSSLGVEPFGAGKKAGSFLPRTRSRKHSSL